MRVTCGAEIHAAAVAGVLLAAMSGCSSTAEPARNASDNRQQAATPANSALDQPQALLAPGDAPSFEKFDDARYNVTAGVSPEGCVTVTLEDGRTLLLFAPYGSRLSAESPRIRLTGDYDSFDVGDSVALSGWVQDVWKAVGMSAPTEWRRCVGGRGDHEPMLVVATNDD
ncbi:hypothetical protein [Nocardioides lacusdianchii]|uniref:hypothetical protein n=1 Tax=Nocardioides lacusdianchii TaxID=2783664 RepID=UPI001CCC3AB5|nr:hypothetical protein [Nocardioides lacusdianchii]